MRSERNQGDGNWVNSRDEERYDGTDLPQPLTFAALYRGAAHTYLHQWDEAMKHNRVNALAMRRDCWLMSLLAERVDDTIAKKWHLEVDNPRDPWQKSVCDGVTRIFQSTPHLKSMMRYMMHGRLWYGRYGSNLKWVWDTMYVPSVQPTGPVAPGVVSEAQFEKKRVLRIQKHKPINGDKISFHYDDTPYVQLNAGWTDKLRGRPDVIYPVGSGSAALLLRGTWREQVFISEYDPEDADFFEAEMAAGIHGVGIRSRIYWLDFMRRDYISWVTESLERIGLGLVVIHYDASNPDAEAEAKKVAKTYSRRAAIVMPRSPDSTWTGGSIEVVEAPTNGAQIVLGLQKHIEDQIERYIIGQTMSAGSDNASKLGGSGEAEFAADTKGKRCRFDADDFADSLTGSDTDPSPIWVIKKWNYPFADFPVRFVYDHEKDDPAKKMESIKTCVDMGVSFPESQIRELTGIPAPQEGDEIIGGKQALALEQMANMATGGVIGGGQEQSDMDESDLPDQFEGGWKEESFQADTPIVTYSAEPGDTHWVTMGGHAEGGAQHAGGFAVQLDKSGRIVKGPKELQGKHVSEVRGEFRKLRKPGQKKPNKPENFGAKDLPEVVGHTHLADLHKQSGMSLGDFQDAVRHHVSQGALQLHPYQGAAYTMENEHAGLVHEGQVHLHVSPTGKKPSSPIPPKATAEAVQKFKAGLQAKLAEHHARNPMGMASMAELHKDSGLSIGQFHDALREAVENKSVRLHPFTGAAYTHKDSHLSMPAGQEIKSYVQPIQNYSSDLTTEDYAIDTSRPEDEQAADLHAIIERIRRLNIDKWLLPQLAKFLHKAPHLARRLPAGDLAYLNQS